MRIFTEKMSDAETGDEDAAGAAEARILGAIGALISFPLELKYKK